MYTINKLGYDYDALEPYIDTHTLGLHYNKHLKKYLKELNNLLVKNNYNFRYKLIELPKHINEFPESDRLNILFNLGGVINHEIYFKSMNPNPVKPNYILNQLINYNFKDYDNFKKSFKESALSIKGSGYTYLVLNKNKLEIVNFLNQDNPYNYNLIPLLCIDMWEHAYYLNYKNNKDLYIDNFLDVVDFSEANRYFVN